VVLSVAVILPQSKAALQLLKENWEQEGIMAGTKAYARIIIKVYLYISLFGFFLLLLLGVRWFDALVHVLAAVSTGGFSSFDNSLAGFGGRFVPVAVILVSCMGAIPIVVYSVLFVRGRNGWREVTANAEIRGLALAFVIASLLTSLLLLTVDGIPLDSAFENGTLIALSAQTTTGFSTLHVADLSGSTKFVLIMYMLIGGNVGSTAGGIKILRLLIILKVAQLFIIRSSMPSDAVVHPRLMGRRLESGEIERCFLLVFFFAVIITLSWFPFILMGYPFLDSLFEVVSATCTVGLSTGISSSSLPALLKGILCIDMLMGRLEIVAFLVLFYPSTWIGQKRGV
jgi:trk system potassium uptake protein TrkH